MWKVNDGRTTDGQTTRDHNSAREPSAQLCIDMGLMTHIHVYLT